MTTERGPAGATLRVVVRLARREAEAEVPADRPVSDLVPDLLRAVLTSADAEVAAQLPWCAGPPGGPPFPASSTLAELAVAGGSIVQLAQVSRRRPPEPPALTVVAGAGDLLLPRQRTLAALPARERLAGRAAAAVGALLARDRALPPAPLLPMAPAPGAYLPPAQLTVLRRPGALERARARWREGAYLRRLDAAIQQPQLRRCVTIAVMSPKGGVGKTTVCALLGTLFALLRRDRVVAVDANPDFGSLGRCLAPGHEVFVDDVLRLVAGRELGVTALDASLGRAAHGLMVLPVPGAPERMARLDEAAYARVVCRLAELVGMVLLDCGTGLNDEAARAALAAADQVLLVTDPDPSTASLVVEAAGVLRERGLPTWLVVNGMTRRSRLELGSLESFVPYARGMPVLPAHRAAAARVAGGTFDWRDAPVAWRVAVRELAAALVASWPGLGLAVGQGG